MPDYAREILLAADSIEQLRKVDVFRVLDTSPNIIQLAAWITKQRPDLAQEVKECIRDILSNA